MSSTHESFVNILARSSYGLLDKNELGEINIEDMHTGYMKTDEGITSYQLWIKECKFSFIARCNLPPYLLDNVHLKVLFNLDIELIN